jgi:hypothetical protein
MVRWSEHVASIEEKRNTCRFLVEENLKDVSPLEGLTVDAMTTLAWIFRHKHGGYGLD